MQSVRDDLAFLKSVANDEGQLPWILGATFFAGGLTFGLPVVADWAQVLGMIPGGSWQLWMWVVASGLFTAVQVTLSRLGPKPRPGQSLGRAFLPTWAGMGLITVVMVTVFAIADLRLHTHLVWGIWASLIFAIWGGAWMGVAILRPRRGWMWVALGSFATAIVNATLIGSANSVLGCALGIVVWMSAPGLMIMLGGRART